MKIHEAAFNAFIVGNGAYFNSLSNRELVSGPLESITRTLPQRILQIPDRKTAADIWNLHTPQAVDIETLVPTFPKVSEQDLIKLTPDASWYFVSDNSGRTHERSTHGMQHSLRVALYARVFAEKEHLSEREIKILDAVALTHDLGRENDTVDTNHGKRAASWLDDHWQNLEERGIYLNNDERKLVQLIVRCHELPYRKIPQQALAKGRILLRIFRAADALDRYRTPSEAWWPDPRYAGDVQIKGFMEYLMPFAKYFTLATEYYRTHHEPDIVTSTRAIGEQIGLISQPEFLQSRRKALILSQSKAT